MASNSSEQPGSYNNGGIEVPTMHWLDFKVLGIARMNRFWARLEKWWKLNHPEIS